MTLFNDQKRETPEKPVMSSHMPGCLPEEDLDDFIFRDEPVKFCSER